MIRIIRLAAFITTITATAISAQAPSIVPVPDSSADPALRNNVTAYVIRSGKLALSSAANPGQTYLPDATYTNEAGMIIVFLGGKITRVQQASGEITEIASTRVDRQRIIRLTPSTNALNAVSEMPLPSGTFTSEDGKSSITIVFGRPTAFTLSGGSETNQAEKK